MKTQIITRKWIGLGILIFSFLIAPMQLTSQTSINKNGHTYTVNSNGKGKIHYKNNGNDFRIEYDGKIEISNDDTDVISISRGGFLEIKKSSFGNKRRILIESDGGQNLIKKYFVGSKEKSFNPDGKQWLAEVLPDIVRSTKIGAESRVNRFYSNGGAKSVINEINRIDSDYIKTYYYELLLSKKLNSSELVAVLESVGKQIKSDHYLSQILRKNQKNFLLNGQTTTAYINATKHINSDHYMAQVLKDIIKDKTISDSQMSSLLEITSKINSDHYLAQILTDVMQYRDLNDQNVTKIILLSKQINSDHYKTQVLKKALDQKNLSNSAYQSFLSVIDDINSDHYASEIANELLDQKLDDNSVNTLLSIIDQNINSDHYASNILKKMADQNNLSDDMLVAILKTAGKSLNSDHYLSSTLVKYADKVNNSSEKVKAAYRNAAKSMGSDTYYGKALKALN